MRRAALTALLCAASTLAHADRFAIYLGDIEAARLVATLQRADLTRVENIAATAYLSSGLQVWPTAETIATDCARTAAGVPVPPWRRIVVGPDPDDPNVTRANLSALLDGIAGHVTDPGTQMSIKSLALYVRRCGESVAQ